MNMQKTHKIGGFTIIEVVLVLAIAGLIFLLVFLAFPALQRSNQDTQRRNDIGRVVSQVANYQSNNQGLLPTNWGTFRDNYLTTGGEIFDDPVHGPYTLTTTSVNNQVPGDGVILVHQQRVCDGENAAAGGARNVAFRVKLANGGVSCQNN
jgi:type II secretory pathway pseudopilin PulG